jgi:hypothetical protein
MLDERSPELLDALGARLGETLGLEGPILVDSLHTGGGVFVAAVDLSQDGRFIGRQVWLTREDEWILGVYDFAADEADEGVCVTLFAPQDRAEDPQWIAGQVAGILRRLGVRLQGA